MNNLNALFEGSIKYSTEGLVLTSVPRSELDKATVQKLEDFDRAFDTITCKDCKDGFYMSLGEINFYWKNDLFIPKRCPDCREKRREAKEAEAYKANLALAVK